MNANARFLNEAREVEANKKAVADRKRSQSNNSRGRGRGRGRWSDHYSRSSYNDRESYNNGGQSSHNSHLKNYTGYRGGRGGYYPGASYGSFQHNLATNGQGQQSNQNTFPSKPMIGWFGQG